MQQSEDILLSIKYIDSSKKILKSIFSYYFLPIVSIVNLMTLYSLLTYENLQDLSGPFALSFVMLAGLAIVFFTILMFFGSMLFLQKRYSSFSISKNHILINSKDIYDIQNVEYVDMPYISTVSRWFELREKNSKKTIGHFVYRFYDTFFFYNSPEIIKNFIESKSLDNREAIDKSIQKDKISCLSLETRNEKIRKITIFLFISLVAQMVAMLLIRLNYHI